MTGSDLAGETCWRVHLPPRHAAELVASLEPLGAQWTMDWGGGQVWVALDRSDDLVRQHAARLGGEANLVAAAPDMRARVAALHPRCSAVAKLEQRVRRAFDPAGVFASGRFTEDTDANQFSA